MPKKEMGRRGLKGILKGLSGASLKVQEKAFIWLKAFWGVSTCPPSHNIKLLKITYYQDRHISCLHDGICYAT